MNYRDGHECEWFPILALKSRRQGYSPDDPRLRHFVWVRTEKRTSLLVEKIYPLDIIDPMVNGKPDMNEDTSPPADEGEMPSLMEPMLIPASSRFRSDLNDLVLELATASTRLTDRLPGPVLASLGGLIRSINCYYSNLIEGHDTHPNDIERALNDDYSNNPEKRNLQLEARAHIEVQEWIDGGGLQGRVTSVAGLCEIHKRFSELLPDELLWTTNPDTRERIQVFPGKFRTHHVRVGNHVPVSPGALPRFLGRFEQVYRSLGRSDALLATAAAHHRLLWIHPFADGNGRVARLMSHAMFLELLGTRGIWSIARGLARREEEYKRHLAECDQVRRNDLDGRGHLSEEALASFSRFFLETCIDQVRFMEGLVEPHELHRRILSWAEEEIRSGNLPAKAHRILEALLIRGSIKRGEASGILDVSDRHARRILSALAEHRVITSESPRAPVTLAFPARLAPKWMPGLFPSNA